MHILLTRPLEDSQEMILKFQSLGHEISHIPLINVESKKQQKMRKFLDQKGALPKPFLMSVKKTSYLISFQKFSSFTNHYKLLQIVVPLLLYNMNIM